MRIGSNRTQDEPHIDLVPLIDVILVLIIFFVVTTTFDARSTLQVQLPTASDQKTSAPQSSLSVLVNADGRYFVNDQEVLRTDIESLKQIIAQLANSLEAVVSQRLLPTPSGQGRALASETLIVNTAVRACIRERRWEQLVGLIEIGGRDGMNTIEESLSDLVHTGAITEEQGMAEARDPEVFQSFLQSARKK